MIALFGTAAVCIAATIAAVVDWASPGTSLVLVGTGLYLVGVMVMTAAYHVPPNNALAVLDPETGEAVAYWQRYQREWKSRNHIRTIAPLAAAVLYTLALTAT